MWKTLETDRSAALKTSWVAVRNGMAGAMTWKAAEEFEDTDSGDSGEERNDTLVHAGQARWKQNSALSAFGRPIPETKL